MPSLEQTQEKVVFGLDIGTRSVVGTVGFMKDGVFNVIAQNVQKHSTRAMLDGQIHDIGKVGATIKVVKEHLEQDTDIHLTEVCIAAAGRVLRTKKTTYDYEYPDGHEITDEDIYNLDSSAVEKAYTEFIAENTSDVKFYLVGYSVMHYYLDGYQIANLEGHNAGKVSVELIATFLPDDCIDGLYKACERAELSVANVTLEPIAAMMVAIPDRFRMLNLALIDVGAGTSDICITNDGTITAYGMLPVAGDSITEIIARHCLVDFNTADQIKIDASSNDKVTYMDIMGLEKTITTKEINKVIKPHIDEMAAQVTEAVMKLNGDKPVSAVFVVGGGGCVPGYTQAIAKKMKIPEERVALRGSEVMNNINFMMEEGDIKRDSLLVTPLGICYSYYEECNNFVFVSFNGTQTKLYDNGKLAVVDAAMQAEFPNEDLFPKRGEELVFTVNDKEKVVRGEAGEGAVITLNGKPADIHSKIHANDIIEVKSSTAGEPGRADINSIPEFKSTFSVNVNGKNIDAPKLATVNGQQQTRFYDIQPGDDIKILDYETAEQIAALMDIELTPDTIITVNNEVADKDTRVYENFKVEFKDREEAIMDYYKDFDDNSKGVPAKGSFAALPDDDGEYERNIAARDEALAQKALEEAMNTENVENAETIEGTDVAEGTETSGENGDIIPIKRVLPHDLHVIVNNEQITLHGKAEYVFVDVFDAIDFDLSQPKGRAIVTLLNGSTPDYMQKLGEGDKLEIYWQENIV